jgi:hypothetical protein
LFKQNLKKQNMKKLFFVLAVTAFVACNNGGESKDVKADTTAAPVENATTAAPTTPADTTTAAPADTTAAAK